MKVRIVVMSLIFVVALVMAGCSSRETDSAGAKWQDLGNQTGPLFGQHLPRCVRTEVLLNENIPKLLAPRRKWSTIMNGAPSTLLWMWGVGCAKLRMFQ